MDFYDGIGKFTEDQFISGEFKMFPEGKHLVRITHAEFKITASSGEMLILNIVNSDYCTGRIFFNTKNFSDIAVKISIEEFNRLLIQLPEAKINNFLKQKDFALLVGEKISVICKHKDYNDQKKAIFFVDREESYKNYLKMKENIDLENIFGESPF